MNSSEPFNNIAPAVVINIGGYVVSIYESKCQTMWAWATTKPNGSKADSDRKIYNSRPDTVLGAMESLNDWNTEDICDVLSSQKRDINNMLMASYKNVAGEVAVIKASALMAKNKIPAGCN